MDYLKRIEKELDLPPGERDQVLRELKSHYEEIKVELSALEMDDVQLEREIERRLGKPSDIANRLRTVHMQASWKSTFLAVLPFIGVAVIHLLPTLHYQTNVFLLSKHFIYYTIFGFAVLIGSVREIWRDRRPVWLVTWLAAIIWMIIYLSNNYIAHIYPHQGYDHFNLVGNIVWPIFILLVSRDNLWWGLGTLPLVIASIALNISVITIFVFPLYFAVKALSKHKYGSLYQASLFLFSILYFSNTIFPKSFGFWIIIVFVMLFVRAPAWMRKFIILTVGIILITIFDNTSIGTVRIGYTESTKVIINGIIWDVCIIGTFILSPMLYDFWQKSKMPEIVE